LPIWPFFLAEKRGIVGAVSQSGSVKPTNAWASRFINSVAGSAWVMIEAHVSMRLINLLFNARRDQPIRREVRAKYSDRAASLPGW